MAGWNTIQTIRKLEERAELLGMRFAAYKHDDLYGENVALVPKDQAALPIYSRDAVLFAGSLEAADKFMQGVLWAQDYDRMLKVSDVKKRTRKEQDVRNQQLVCMLTRSQENLNNA
jgi:hypothetical protein